MILRWNKFNLRLSSNIWEYGNEKMINRKKNTGFLRLNQVLEKIPVSKSTWWLGIQNDQYPKPVKLSERTSAWRVCDIDMLVERLGDQNEEY